jgi:hypothetical protein
MWKGCAGSGKQQVEALRSTGQKISIPEFPFKEENEAPFSNDREKTLTTEIGAPVADDRNSMTAGPRPTAAAAELAALRETRGLQSRTDSGTRS